jgi:hypothetical protein
MAAPKAGIFFPCGEPLTNLIVVGFINSNACSCRPLLHLQFSLVPQELQRQMRCLPRPLYGDGQTAASATVRRLIVCLSFHGNFDSGKTFARRLRSFKAKRGSEHFPLIWRCQFMKALHSMLNNSSCPSA